MQHSPGNTLSEYAVIIGLLAVASIGALTLLGNSISASYKPLLEGNSSQTLQQMSQLDFRSSAPGSPGSSIAVSTKGLYLQLTNISGNGVNATSLEGINDTPTGTAIGTANQLRTLADQVTDPALKSAILAAAESVLKLSAAQASVELSQAHDPTGIMSQLVAAAGLGTVHLNDAVNSVGLYQKDIEDKMYALAHLSTSNQAELHEAYQLLAGVTSTNWNQYSPLVTTINTAGARFYQPDTSQFKIVSGSALQTGALSPTPALATSVNTGLTLSNP